MLLQDTSLTVQPGGSEIYVWIDPRREDGRASRYMRFDLTTRACVNEYDYQLAPGSKDVPALRLTDTLMLAENYEEYRYSLLDLVSGELILLDIDLDWTDNDYYYYPEFIVGDGYVLMDHIMADGRRGKVYTTVENLIAGNSQLTEFSEE